jgi:hypothetical protein
MSHRVSWKIRTIETLVMPRRRKRLQEVWFFDPRNLCSEFTPKFLNIYSSLSTLFPVEFIHLKCFFFECSFDS